MGRGRGDGKLREESTLGKRNVPSECLELNVEILQLLCCLSEHALWKSPVLLFGSIKLPKYPWGKGYLSLSDTLELLIKIE